MSELTYTAAERSRAERIARRVDEQRCGLAFTTIVLVICAVLNVAINCWRAAHQVTPEMAQAELARRCATRSGRRYWSLRLSGEIRHHDPQLSGFQADAIAGAIIDEALEENNAGEFRRLMEMPA